MYQRLMLPSGKLVDYDPEPEPTAYETVKIHMFSDCVDEDAYGARTVTVGLEDILAISRWHAEARGE